MKYIMRVLFASFPNFDKERFSKETDQKNYTRSVFLSKVLLGVSLLMYLIAIFEDDLKIIKDFNLVYFTSSLVIFILFVILKPKDGNLKKSHSILVLVLIVISLLWASSLMAFAPNRYELIGTYSIIILSLSAMLYIKWKVLLALYFISLSYIFVILVLEGDFFFMDPVIPKVTVVIFLNVISFGISRMLYHKYLENFELTIQLQQQNEKIQFEVEKKSRELTKSEENSLLIMNSTAEGIYGTDKKGNCTFVNKSFLELLGYTNKEEVIGKNIHELIHHSYEDGSHFPEEDCEMSKALFDRKYIRIDDFIWRKDGTMFPVAYSSSPPIRNGNILGSIVSFKDITERTTLVNSLEFERNNSQMYLDVVGVMLIVLDTKGLVTLINRRGCEILGLDEKEILGKNWIDNFLPKYQVEEIRAIFNNRISNNEEFSSKYVNSIITASGEEKNISWTNTTLYDDNKDVIGVISSGADITELIEKEQELIYEAYNDFLTGLHNRRYFEEKIRELDRIENYPLTIVMADINGLKLINDAFGHLSGDELLKSTSYIITDICTENDLIARIGGDEFVIVMPNTTEKEAGKIIRKIKNAAKLIEIQSIPLSISFGYKSKSLASEDIQDVYRSAEDLMYREKLLEIPSMRSGAIETILSTLYEKDEKSEIHSRSVSLYSERLAEAYGMNPQDVAEVKTAGLLHDIGKIIISSSIINKKGKLTSQEYSIMKKHPEIGFRILNSTSNMRGISNIVLDHHERCDGKGYPRGIKCEEISIKSRIISIADAFDAMTSERTYRDIISNEEALKEIIINSGTQFDPELVKVFEEHFTEITAQ